MNTDPEMTCPYCAETIKAAVILCRYCHSDLSLVHMTRLHRPVETYRRPYPPTGHHGVVFECAVEGCGYVTKIFQRPEDVEPLAMVRFQDHAAEVLFGPAQGPLGKVPRMPDPEAAEEPHWANSSRAVPLLQWRGRRHLTNRPSVPSYCTSCGNEWQLPAKVTNTIAQELGLGGRLIRGGLTLERLGATFTPFAAGRRIAAGNEEERQLYRLAHLLKLTACPNCASTDVVLADS